MINTKRIANDKGRMTKDEWPIKQYSFILEIMLIYRNLRFWLASKTHEMHH
jgi:hypothetical protein